MITTNCPDCEAPKLCNIDGAITGTYAPVECDSCDSVMVIEVTRLGGITYEQEYFEAEVLPDLQDVERIDHPSGEATIYGDPDKIGIKDK